jgi:hypothetical protein
MRDSSSKRFSFSISLEGNLLLNADSTKISTSLLHQLSLQIKAETLH